jgi:hypothetical protein
MESLWLFFAYGGWHLTAITLACSTQGALHRPNSFGTARSFATTPQLAPSCGFRGRTESCWCAASRLAHRAKYTDRLMGPHQLTPFAYDVCIRALKRVQTAHAHRSIGDLPINENGRKYHRRLGCRPDGHADNLAPKRFGLSRVRARRLMYQIAGAFAEFERGTMREAGNGSESSGSPLSTYRAKLFPRFVSLVQS